MITATTYPLPSFVRVRQTVAPEGYPPIEDIEGAVAEQMASLRIDGRFTGGKRIAITAGSRGIANMDRTLRAIAAYVREKGGSPFIVPAMGSHGGATAEGQKELLAHYGITEETMGCPILSSMDTEYLGTTADGVGVYCDKNAYHSDGIIACNRVKPHTDFSAANESGVLKILAIGLGKEKGASTIHRAGLAKNVHDVGAALLERAPVLGAIALVEDPYDRTCVVRAVHHDTFVEEDAALQKLAGSLCPRLPMDSLDLLVVKELSKAYSGTNMDTKVIGRIRVPGTPEPERPQIDTIVALRLSPVSCGNATGIGLADYTTRAFFNDIDFDATRVNVNTSTYLERGKIPLFWDTEKEAIEMGARHTGVDDPALLRAAVIENTLHLGTMLVTEPVLADCPGLEVVERGISLCFDDEGRLLN